MKALLNSIFAITIFASLLCAEILEQNINMQVFPAQKKLNIQQTLRFESGSEFFFDILPHMRVDSLTLNGKERQFEVLDENGVRSISILGKLMDGFTFRNRQPEVEFFLSVDFSHLQTDGLHLSQQGFFFSSVSGIVPSQNKNCGLVSLELSLPDNWEFFSDQDFTQSFSKNSFHCSSPGTMEGEFFGLAAPWYAQKHSAMGIDVYSAEFNENDSNMPEFVSKAFNYFQLYGELFTPYPFPAFVIMESFLEQDLQIPGFIIMPKEGLSDHISFFTELRKAVITAWWGGNVQGEEGEIWPAGLREYFSHFLYNPQNNLFAGRHIRKKFLKQYLQDKEAIHGLTLKAADQAAPEYKEVMERKMAMVFHMISERIGEESFLLTLAAVQDKFAGETLSWEQLLVEFEHVSGQNFQRFSKTWMRGHSDPSINITQSRTGEFYLNQSTPPKDMWVPIRIRYAERMHNLQLEISGSSVQIPLPKANPSMIELDPNYNVMRILDGTELDATISMLNEEGEIFFIMPEDNSFWQDLGQNFWANISPELEMNLIYDDQMLESGARVYLGSRTQAIEKLLQNGDIQLFGENFDAMEHSLVWASEDAGGFPVISIYSENPKELLLLSRQIMRYGKYGYLLFRHGNLIRKGNHRPLISPVIWSAGS